MTDDATRAAVCQTPHLNDPTPCDDCGYPGNATPKRVTNAELRREAERLAPFSPRARHATGSRAAKIHPRLGSAIVMAFLGLPAVALARYGWLPVAAWFVGMIAVVVAAFFLRQFTWGTTDE